MKRHSKTIVGLLLASVMLAFGVYIYIRYLAPKQDEPLVVSSIMSDSLSVSSSASSHKSIAVSSETETASEEASFDVAPIRELFHSVFGKVKGQHSLYFQDLTANAQEPLVVNDQVVRSASTIKLFVLAALYDAVAQGQVTLTEMYDLTAEDIVGGTGNLQAQAVGTTYTLQELAHEMIVVSDNTATNILIERLGMMRINDFIKRQGYTKTHLARKMLDLTALESGIDNVIAVSEVGNLMARLYRQQLISPQADREMLAILKQQQDRNKLLANLPMGTVSYSKSGQFAEYGICHDVAVIETSKGAFVLAVLSQDGEEAAQQAALQTLGQQVYQMYTR